MLDARLRYPKNSRGESERARKPVTVDTPKNETRSSQQLAGAHLHAGFGRPGPVCLDSYSDLFRTGPILVKAGLSVVHGTSQQDATLFLSMSSQQLPTLAWTE